MYVNALLSVILQHNIFHTEAGQHIGRECDVMYISCDGRASWKQLDYFINRVNCQIAIHMWPTILTF